MKYGVVGQGTADTLFKFTNNISFVGLNDVEEVSKQFSQLVNSKEIVLFPVSNQSRKTIQKELKEDQILNIQAYSTIEESKEILPCEAYVFTSPSNVESFFKLNKINQGAKVIAIGKPTKEKLEGYSCRNVDIAWNYNNLALWDSI